MPPSDHPVPPPATGALPPRPGGRWRTPMRLLVVAPAGIGAREAALVLLLGSTVTAPRATVLAVVSRLLLAVGDLVWAAVAVGAWRLPGARTRSAGR